MERPPPSPPQAGGSAAICTRTRTARMAWPHPSRSSPSTVLQSRNLAASAGRWSAQHRKAAILGWILFVVLATVIGGRVGLNEIDESASGS